MKIPIQTIRIASDDYPPLLRRIPKPPEILYCIGAIAALHHTPIIAIVGTRRATRYGLETAHDLARDASSSGIAVVSGLALGIDAEAHAGALEGKAPTIAVLGSGLNHILPSTNYQLAERILEQGGAIVSEFEPDITPNAQTFPQRNRIIAGLASATLVVEAPEKSGALITARFALDFNRDVGAVPGEITSLNSYGTNQLLRDGAAVIRSLADLYELLGMDATQTLPLDIGSESDDNLLRLLETPQDTQTLAELSSCPVAELMGTLSRLEISGRIKNIGGTFQKIK